MIALLLVGWALAADPALDDRLLGAEPAATAAGSSVDSAVPTWTFGVVAMGALGAAAWGAQRWRRPAKPAPAIRILATSALAQGCSLALVEIDGRRLLVGTGAGAPSLLVELDPALPEDIDEPSEKVEDRRPLGDDRRTRAVRLLDAAIAERSAS